MTVLGHFGEFVGDAVLLRGGLGGLYLGRLRGRVLLAANPLDVLPGSGEVVDQLLELLGRECGSGGRIWLVHLSGRLGEPVEHSILLGEGLVVLLLKELCGCLLGSRRGFLEGLLGGAGGIELLAKLGQLAADVGLLLNQFVGLGGIGLAGRLANLLLTLGDVLEQVPRSRRVALHEPLRPADDLQQPAQAADDGFLALGGRVEGDLLEGLRGVVDLGVDAGDFEELEAAEGLGADGAAPGADVSQHLLEPQVERLDVALILNGLEHERLTPDGGLLGERAGVGENFRLHFDQPTDLGGDLGHAQTPQQVLPLDEEPHEDVAAFLAGFDKELFAVLGRSFLHPLEHGDDFGHFSVDELVEVFAHAAYVAVELQLDEAVLFELLDLHVEHASDELPRHAADLALELLLAGGRGGIDGGGLRGEQRRGEAEQGKSDGCEASLVIHGPPPTPIWRWIMVSSWRADSRSVSAMAARMPCSSVTWRTSGSDSADLPGRRRGHRWRGG